MCALSANASILYRGRLSQSVTAESTFDALSSYDMTFKVYSQAQGGTALWTLVTNSVPVGTDGGFEVLLAGDELDAACDNEAREVYVGLTLEDERELMPRRQILFVPTVLKADKADAIGYRPVIDSLSSHHLEAKKITTGSLTIGGNFSTTNSTDSLNVTGAKIPKGASLDLTAHTVSMLGDVTTIADGVSGVAAGATIATAPADGLAFICTQYAETATPAITGVTVFARKGDAIKAPVAIPADQTVRVRFYSFLAR